MILVMILQLQIMQKLSWDPQSLSSQRGGPLYLGSCHSPVVVIMGTARRGGRGGHPFPWKWKCLLPKPQNLPTGQEKRRARMMRLMLGLKNSLSSCSRVQERSAFYSSCSRSLERIGSGQMVNYSSGPSQYKKHAWKPLEPAPILVCLADVHQKPYQGSPSCAPFVVYAPKMHQLFTVDCRTKPPATSVPGAYWIVVGDVQCVAEKYIWYVSILLPEVHFCIVS